MIRTATIVTIACALLTACADDVDHPDAAGPQTDAKAQHLAVIAKARQANQASIELNYQWTTVPELLQQAEQSAQDGDFQTATERAVEALKHAELSIEQAHRQAEAWQAVVPR